MARPQKRGIDYFSFDVDLFDDDKVMRVAEMFGWQGELILVKLLCQIYKEGYSIVWDETSSIVFAKRVMCDPSSRSVVNDVVQFLVSIDFFDEAMFNRYNILTSKGIQERWIIAKNNKRRTAEIEPRFNLIKEEQLLYVLEHQEFLPKKNEETTVKREETSVKREETPVKREETPVKREETPIKKSKENKRKENYPPYPLSGEFADDISDSEAVSESPPSEDYPHREIVEAWNEVFPGPVQSEPRHIPAPPDGLNALFWEHARQAEEAGFTRDEFRRAFAALRDDPSRDWQIHSAVKPGNLRILLTRWKNQRDGPKNARSGANEPYGRDKPGYGKRGYYT